MKNRPIALILACVLAALVGCNRLPEEETSDHLFTIPSFTLTNQDNEPFGSEQLQGKTWIACLFFTECAGPCPMMAARLREMQEAVDDPNVLLVSVSCDPQKDTPETLKNYAKAVGAVEGRWYFLTGQPEQVQEFATQGLKLHYSPADATQPIEHSTKFLLIDGNHNVRGIYDTEDNASMIKLKVDARKLAGKK